jgi:hypothetical protein
MAEKAKEHLRAKWKVLKMVKNNEQADIVRFCLVFYGKALFADMLFANFFPVEGFFRRDL